MHHTTLTLKSTPLRDCTIHEQGKAVQVEFRYGRAVYTFRATASVKKGEVVSYTGIVEPIVGKRPPERRTYKKLADFVQDVRIEFVQLFIPIRHEVFCENVDLFTVEGLLEGYGCSFYATRSGRWAVAWKASSMPAAAFKYCDSFDEAFRYVLGFYRDYREMNAPVVA